MTTTHTPTTCHVCGRHAVGVGFSNPPRWLCHECADILEHIKSVRRFDAYELKARQGGVEAAGAYLKEIGKTDLAEFEAEEAEILCGRIWKGCADELRRVIKAGEAPF